MHPTQQFAHVFLFRCPQCGRPLPTACMSALRNLEQADAHRFDPHCRCGWSGGFAGLMAVKHWVEPWENAFEVDDGSNCDKEALK